MGVLVPLARLLFSAIFITSGLNHFIQLDALTTVAQNAGVPEPRWAVLVSGAALVLGGLSVLLGVLARLGAAAIAIFLVTAAFMVHRFWLVADPVQAQDQLIHFMKNLSMAGGALFIVYFGSGPFSLRRGGRQESGLGGGRLGSPLRH
ncbi:DoxX family protein [Myxococcus sp. MISCRS1]|jgi:putative oxidoreductase|uniref:Oxidoreductase n=1 Tax=Myxococcus fulvus TaxID=33 RepID=A0A511T937_MYXFU|nr:MULTISPECIES: DoxX family protein [Myxococcus]AKF84106.1 DoxX family protein [Myxococcus fulvus 124B02]BDT38179.1 DoxX family protein [Myxococcus sp. MH1]MBZ4398607.1 DoxX family protein [Myxococcus sp. AS-1-15]MBZ4414449.1 DoxX family protein [Myxococcus sp. XM-1-1-1]MCK8503847.1 DoxX family protein [Myxococcus fulvus]